MLQKKGIMEKQLIEPCNENCSFCFLNYADVLSGNYLFKGLKPIEVGGIIRNIHHSARSFGKGEVIARAGDHYEVLLIIVKGSVVGEMVDFEGNILRVEQLSAPDTIASAFIFGDNNILPVNIVAMTVTKLLLIPRGDLLGLLKSNEIVLKNYLGIMSNRAQHLSGKLKLLSMQSIEGKLAHYLLDLINKQESIEIILPHTQNDLAEMFGVQRPSLSRALRKLHYEGTIEAKGKNIKIIDKNRLSGMLR